MKSVIRTVILGIACLVCGLGVWGADESALDNEALGKLKLGQKAVEVVALIGKPESKGEDTEWGATGEWVQEWRFDKQGLTLNLASAKKAVPSPSSPSRLKLRAHLQPHAAFALAAPAPR